jgi:hypothetical protein
MVIVGVPVKFGQGFSRHVELRLIVPFENPRITLSEHLDDRRVRPWVAAVVVKDESLLAMAHGGEVPRCHSEYVAEMMLVDTFVPGATFRTLLKYE